MFNRNMFITADRIQQYSKILKEKETFLKTQKNQQSRKEEVKIYIYITVPL